MGSRQFSEESRHGAADRPARRGQALVPVIFVVMILTALVVTFAMSARREVRAAANFTTQTDRFFAAKGALNYALSALAKSSNNGADIGTMPTTGDFDERGWLRIGDARVKIEVIGTTSRINLNFVDAATLEKFPALADRDDIAQAILDWRSSGDQPSQNGAKSDYYQGLATPYNAKDGAFDTVDELLLVRGVTPSLLYEAPNSGAAGSTGSGSAGLGVESTGGSSDLDAIFASSTRPLSELLTTYSRERNVSTDGTARVNLNTATQQDLQDQLGLTPTQAQAIVTYRTTPASTGTGTGTGTGTTPGTTTGTGTGTGSTGRPTGSGSSGAGGLGSTSSDAGGLQNMKRALRRSRQSLGLGSSTNLGNVAGSSSGGSTGSTGSSGATSSTGSTGTGSTGTGTTSTTPQGQGFTSIANLLDVSGFTTDDVQNLADKVTVDAGAYRDNVIDVNSAPAEVLATIPGITKDTIDQILSARQQGQTFRTMGDLFAMQNITSDQFKAIAKYLTTKSSAYIVRIRVRIPGQPGIYAVSALVEMTENGPRVLQWRETPRYPGWSSWIAPETTGAGNQPGSSLNSAPNSGSY